MSSIAKRWPKIKDQVDVLIKCLVNRPIKQVFDRPVSVTAEITRPLADFPDFT